MPLNLDKAFNFTAGMRRGIFFLLLLLSGLVVYNYIDETGEVNLAENESAKAKIDSFLASGISTNGDTLSHERDNTAKESKNDFDRKKLVIRMHPFDPNTMVYKDFLSLGFSQKQARTIEKYLKKGGRFYYKEDFKKIHCISDDDYNRVEDYILLEERPKGKDSGENTLRDLVKTELNSATVTDLMNISGIGPYIARNIVKYRQLLGGYYSVSQLLEVYGIDSARYNSIGVYFYVNPDSIKKTNINGQDFYSLKRHPYITKVQAFEITNRIKYKGKFHSLEELKKLNSIKNSDFEKICHYFVVE